MDLSSFADGQEGERPLRDYGNRDVVDQRQIESHHTEEWGNTPMYVGLHFPSDSKKKRHRHRHKHRHPPPAKNTSDEPIKPSTPPSERVQFLLGQDDNDEAHKAHDMFCEMDELRCVGDDGDLEWKETARWVKFEEDVEEGGERWSKPHVATLSLHSLFELRKGLLSGTVMLDMNANNIFQVADLVLDNMVASKHLEESKKELVRDALLSRHRHQHNKSNHNEKKGLPLIRSLAEIGKKHSEKKLEHKVTSILYRNRALYYDGLSKSRTEPGQLKGSGSSKDLLRTESGGNLPETASSHKVNQHFMKKLPPGAEASNILVGEVDFLSNPIIAFVRLTKAEMLGDLTEVPVPTRFIFLLLGPQGHKERYHEIGRSIATLMSDEIFHDVAYKAKHREDLLAGIDEFLDQVTVLPPGEWDPSIRIEPPPSVPSQSSRKTGGQLPRGGSGTLGYVPNGSAVKEEEEEEHGDATLVRSGRLFGGLINDVRRKAPFYVSDIKDALHIQCLASFVFLYFACLTPIITFGGLLGQATDDNIAAMESILCGAISGISYHLFSGQPLTIIGSTGPVLVFENIVFSFCKDSGLNYLPFRFWIGMWVCVCLLIMVAFDLSALVRYITRFTEESFAVLIGLIFIYEAFKKLIHISEHDAPVDLTPDFDENYTCLCYPPLPTPSPNTTAYTTDGMQAVTTISSLVTTLTGNATNVTTAPDEYFGLDYEACKKAKGVPIGPGCGHHEPVADVFFLSCLLFLGTFAISFSLKEFKTSRYFPTKVRSLISDFSVLLAIVLMGGVDIGLGLQTPKLKVPTNFKPTRDDRGWVVNPLDNPLWTIPAGILPALLATILIFMDQQITAVIVNRKEHKLLKGGGYHLDLFIVAILIGICSILGLPWFVAATVLSINHVRSLTRESETAAPGEKPQFLGVREQRVTGVVVFIFVGLSVVLTGVLKFIPMPVLYGVFLFMGISSLKGVQFIQRITIIFMPPKYQPDYMFLRHVPLKRCHLFTAIQILCLAILWTIKQIKEISIIFPLMVLAMCFVRKAMDFLFTRHELKWLDDIMPESHKREKEDAKKKLEEDREKEEQIIEMRGGGTLQVPLRDGKRLTIPVDQLTYNPMKKEVNISEEMSRTAIWKQLVANEDPETIGGYRPRKRKPRRSSVVEQGRDDIEMQKVKSDSNPQVRFKISDDDDECKPMIIHAPEIVVDPPSTQSR